jgi:hypothetical protein
MIQSNSIGLLTAALIAAQNEFLPVLKTKENPAYKRGNVTSKYAGLDDALEATQPALGKNGLVVIQFPINDAERVGVSSLLVHTSGEFIGDGFTLPLAKQDPQGGVAAVTYARRCGLLAILGVAAEDDDGNTASNVKAGKNEKVQDIEKVGAKTTGMKSTAGAPPEKAQIPNDLGKGTATVASSATATSASAATSTPSENASAPSTASDANEIPNEEELKPFRKQHVALVKLLSENGLTSETGNPQKKKVLAYLLKTTGANSAENVTKGQWRTFFEVTGAANPKELVALVEAAGK